jgi:hypothetical protein
MFDRYVIEDCRVFGHAFKRGDTVKCLLETTNRGQWCSQNQTRLIKPRGPVNVAFGGGIRPRQRTIGAAGITGRFAGLSDRCPTT